MTEDKAKTMWCPYMPRAIGPAAEIVYGKCIASACMMWRIERDGEIPLRALDRSLLGYCGLAGKP